MRRGRVVALPLGLLLLAGSALTAAALTTGGPSAPSPHDEPDTTCDVDGVETGYDVGFSDGTSAYHVTHVDVRGISPTCAGGKAVVVLTSRADGVELGRGESVLDGSGVAKVPVAPVAGGTGGVNAEAATRITVELHGGKVPVPQPCLDADMGFDRVQVGTAGGERLTGTSRRDLVFGLPGADVIDGLPNPDCLDGGPGADTLRGNEGEDVLVGGDGDDRLEGENGDDVLVGGAGHDTCIGGHGRDTFVGCEVAVQ